MVDLRTGHGQADHHEAETPPARECAKHRALGYISPVQRVDFIHAPEIRQTRIESALADTQVVLVDGPRPAGKGTLVRQLWQDRDALDSGAFPPEPVLVSAPITTDNPLHPDALAGVGVVRTLPRRTIVFQEGDTSDQIYGVLSGRLKVYLSDADGREIALDLLGPGQIFGEMSLDGQPRSASVMTLEPCRLVTVQKDAFTRYLAAHPAASLELLLTVIRRARNLTGLAGSLALMDVYGRVVRALNLAALRDGDDLTLPDRLTHQDIASRAGTTREMVSRIVSDLRTSGLLRVEGGRTVLHEAMLERDASASST